MPPTSSTGNFPGFDYLERIAQASVRAFAGHGAILNDAWNGMKKGTYGYREMMKSVAQTVESYLDPLVETSRGPGYMREPAWLYFDYSRAENTALRSTTKIARRESLATELDKTGFADMEHSNPALPKDLYTICDWADSVNRSQILVELDRDRLNKAPAGQYISFIMAKGRSSEQPFVIVLLRVRD